ncbi:hypothetical protein GLOIN_2v1869726 [Rhizophagus irregularis DAOM 181602=DAOM 197198]|nr:hypothetical protein RhiirB3_457344 [Rhizophagus irregularis]GET66171.1 hypothetical protein GLOIN_2v1869726 [Rhizophagus irregularis DAOM 181602=DAOM 197198]
MWFLNTDSISTYNIYIANRFCSIIYVPNTGDLLSDYYELCPNVPEAFKDKYFSRKEMESLLKLKDIINDLK